MRLVPRLCFFCTGCTIASFQYFKTVPSSIDLFIILVQTGTNILEKLRINLVLHGSFGQVVLFFSFNGFGQFFLSYSLKM